MFRTVDFSKYKLQIKKIIYIIIGWMIISIFQFGYEYATILSYGGEVQYDIKSMFLSNLLISFLAGIFGGTILVTLMEYWLRSKPYGLALSYIVGSFSLVYLFVTWIGVSYLVSSKVGIPFYYDLFRLEVLKSIEQIGFIRNFIFWLIVVLGTLIVLMVNDKYGPGVFIAFLLGRYFKPKKEERIFMFLDLRSSTAIAEKLGDELYFDFLKDFFNHATPPVVYSSGSIYQYVGDELVVSWKPHKGKANNNCINCFFEIKKEIQKHKDYYLEKYKILPEFKAGFHNGLVVAGEIGMVKRDIVFSGDVLNTASRIQNQCNNLGVDILVSKRLLDNLSLPPDLFKPKKIGDITLKGKGQKVVLYTM